MPSKNAAVCVASRAPLASRAYPSPVGSKKVAQLPPLYTTLVDPDPEVAASTILELDERWSFVLKKANDSWMWIALCRKRRQVVGYATSRSEQTDLLAFLGEHSIHLSAGALFHRLLGGVQGGDP